MAENTAMDTLKTNEGTELRESTHEPERYLPPTVDIYENDEGLVVVADMPGLEKEDIQLSTEKDVLTIKGVRRDVVERDFLHREFQPHGYFRQFTLGNKIDQSGIAAEYKYGVLKLKLPFAQEVKPRQIDVKVA